jgi:hypothetical protein
MKHTILGLLPDGGSPQAANIHAIKVSPNESQHLDKVLHTMDLDFLLSLNKVVVPSPNTLSWDACSMTHLETHSPMHLK